MRDEPEICVSLIIALKILVSRINSDTQVIQDCLSTNVSMFVRGTVFILATLAILFLISPLLAGSTFAAIIPILVFAAIYGSKIRKY